MSESIGQRVDMALDLQHKANRVLTHILGAQYTLCEHPARTRLLETADGIHSSACTHATYIAIQSQRCHACLHDVSRMQALSAMQHLISRLLSKGRHLNCRSGL